MAALDGAVALAEWDALAIAVDDHLNLDVAVVLQPSLEVERIVAEGRPGLRAADPQRGLELAGRANHPHPLAAAAGRWLDEDRVADPGGLSQGMLVVAEHPVRAGIVGRPCWARRRRVPSFEAKRSRTSAVGPTKARPWAATASAKPESSDRKP